MFPIQYACYSIGRVLFFFFFFLSSVGRAQLKFNSNFNQNSDKRNRSHVHRTFRRRDNVFNFGDNFVVECAQYHHFYSRNISNKLRNYLKISRQNEFAYDGARRRQLSTTIPRSKTALQSATNTNSAFGTNKIWNLLMCRSTHTHTHTFAAIFAVISM